MDIILNQVSYMSDSWSMQDSVLKHKRFLVQFKPANSSAHTHLRFAYDYFLIINFKTNEPSHEPPIFMANDAQSSNTDQPMVHEPMEVDHMVVHKGVSFHYFTIDDIPPDKWKERFMEFHTWLVTKNLIEEDTYKILTELLAHMVIFISFQSHTIPSQIGLS